MVRAGGRVTSLGFTLMEMVGVLAILAILASVIAPVVIESINQARISKEMKDLPTLGDALRRQILSTKSIPNEDWAQVIADELALPINQISMSSGRNPRVFLIDPTIHIGTGVAMLPYTQGANGSATPPVNARVMLISSQGRSLPDWITSGVAASADSFESIWDTPKGTIPPDWPAEWTGKGEFLQIYRLNLAPLFHRLIVSNTTGDGAAAISIDGSASIPVSTSGLSSYYLEGTVIGFYKSGQLESREAITSDSSYLYERGIWRGQPWEGKVKDATDLARGLDAFLTATLNPNAQSGATQQTVIDAYYNYVLTYATWARAGFPSRDVTNQLTPEFQSLKKAQNQLDVVSMHLIFK